ncbi:hypothetical protein LguiA_036284 [Lonicera macranthoides]
MNTYPKTLKSFSIWGDPIPKLLTKKADEYIPKDFEEFIYMRIKCSTYIESRYNSEGGKSYEIYAFQYSSVLD